MVRRSLISLGVLAALMTVSPLGLVPAGAQAPATAAKPNGSPAKAYVPPKTADGQPDISGFWTNSTYIPLQRPQGVTKEFYTPEEMDKLEAAAKAREDEQTVPGTQQDVHYDDGQFGLARSQGTFARNLRTGLIVDPPDGRIPPQTEEGKKRNAEIAAARKVGTPPPGFTLRDLTGGDLDSHRGIKIDTRCIMMAAVPPPLMSPGYLPNYQFIQSPGYVTILVERLHDARIIPLDNRPFPSENVRSWVGVSRGHWEGNTLVVETRNSNGRVQAAERGLMAGQPISGGSPDMRIIERFTRVSPDRIDYRFTVDDPKTWTKPFTAEVPFERMDPQGPFFEHACHEGNYSISIMLNNARLAEKKAAEAAAKKGSN
jgi:hypothetical protein